MANSWFQFKKFKIEQGRSAMKVCTDSCLFGAYVAGFQKADKKKIADVGAGTGLLSFMWAQQNPDSEITSIEPDEGSFADLKLNIESSPWKEKITAFFDNLAEHTKTNLQKYDVVICNPPFFFNHLQSPESQRNDSMHLSFSEWNSWLKNLKLIVKPEGQIWLLMGIDTFSKSQKIWNEIKLYPFEILRLDQNSKPFRMVVGLSKSHNSNPEMKIQEIKGNNGQLSDWASELMNNYYLKG